MGSVLNSSPKIYYEDHRGLIRSPNGTHWEALNILQWENVSRHFSLDTALIEEEAHWHWYQMMSRSENHLLLVVADHSSKMVGAINFKSNNGEQAKIGIILDPSSRGLGLGRWAIAVGCRIAFGERRYKRILAEIRINNFASLQAFRKAGFVQIPGEARKQRIRETEEIRVFEYCRPAATRE